MPPHPCAVIQDHFMAFTLSHPAAILPLHKLPGMALLPLVIGSMTPDLFGFLPYTLEQRLPHSHSPVGTVLIDLPLGLVILVLLRVFRSPLLRPLWQPHRTIIAAAMNNFYDRDRAWLIAIASLLVGSWTHIVWDRFTHDTNWTYRNLPVLYQPVFPDAPHELPIFHVLQYVTSAIGLALFGWYYLRALRRSQVAEVSAPATARSLQLLLLGVMVMAALAGLMRLLASDLAPLSIYIRISVVLKTAIMSFAVLYLLTGLTLRKTLA
jgi:hypothetical protein